MISHTTYDLWLLLVGALCAVACALPGTFLVLRRRAMLADAVSHSVLPGIVLAYLVSGSTHPTALLVGALVVGFVASLAIDWVEERLGLDGGAAIGLVFTSLFALGLLLLVRAADRVHLDADCVLFGGLEEAPLETVRTVFGAVPRAVLVVALAALLQLATVLALFKELQLTTFDADQARLQGIEPRRVHRILLVLTAVSCVAAFEAVGSILVLSLIVVPPATAVLVGQRLSTCLVLACGFGVLAVALGLVLSRSFPRILAALTGADWLAEVEDVSAAGSIAVAAGGLFAGVLLLRSVRSSSV